MRKAAKIAVVILGLFALWFPLTWFSFGSAHPCGMLNYRMRERDGWYAWLDEEDYLSPAGQRRMESTIEMWNEQRLKEFSPAVCLWRVITWRWNPASDPVFQAMQEIKLNRIRGDQ